MGGQHLIFYYDLGGSGGMPPPEIFLCSETQSEAKILVELLNILWLTN